MKLSLTSWSFPACTLEECAGISRALGIGALDVGQFYRSGLSRAQILADPLAVAARVAGLGVAVPNYYHLFGEVRRGRTCRCRGRFRRMRATSPRCWNLPMLPGLGRCLSCRGS